MKTQIYFAAVSGFLVLCAFSANAMTLEQYLETVQNKNRTFSSLRASKEAGNLRYMQGDLELSPQLTAQGSYLDDKGISYTTSGTVDHNQVRQYSLGLGKKFSTGTQIQVQGSIQAANAEGTTASGTFANETHTGTVGVSLSQSLWKNFFGEATRLRWERESAQRGLEVGGYDLQLKQSLSEAEAAFWDLIYLQQELEIRRSGLERAHKIETWVKKRLNNGIGDRSDALNAQGLTASRELQLLATQDELVAAQKKVADQLELSTAEQLPPLEANLKIPRSDWGQNLKSGQGRVVRLDSYLAVLEARAKSVAAKESKDQLRPDLTLEGQYKTNGYDTDDSSAWRRATEKDHPVSAISLKLTWLLDWETKDGVRTAAQRDALAAKLKKERKLLEGESAWSELQRRHQELNKKILAAQKMSEVQNQRASVERELLSRGRSITSQVITAEQDADEAELSLTKLRAEQRKLESQSRLFVKLEDEI
ncbi:MAG: TolC family protein [Bdellovibrio sp. CG10_big_fil_rev_8_21_14_0_10_47_8]|nr:MAG: TolC family protein [Bdellovibrio sp. CG10_big_fil_rev_8_21_14_0_10_47_8]